MSKLLQLDLCAMPFELRYSALQANGIGLWDVVAQAQRKGSLDTAISQATINPLAQRCAALTQLQLIAFNGKTAAKLGSKQIPKYINQVVLPSSSPAHTLKIEQKFSDWQSALSPHLAA